MSECVRTTGVPEAMRDGVLRQYPLRRLRLPVGARIVPLVVPDARAWLRKGQWADGVLAGREPPYWVRLWPSAVAVARQLARAESLAGLRVLDLGCGLGVPGIVAASRGASVTFVDREASALAFACWNAERLAVPGARIERQLLDWGREDVQGEFDVVVLADVSYHGSNHAPLARQLQRVLRPEGAVLHGDPQRVESDRFLRRLAATLHLERSWRPTRWEGPAVVVRLCLAAGGERLGAGWRERLGWPAAEVSADAGSSDGAPAASGEP